MPTLTRTLGIKGERPTVGTWDAKGTVHVFASVDVVTGELVHHLYATEAAERRNDGLSKTARMQREFARHLDAVGQAYPREDFLRVVLLVDGATWHSGKAVKEALERNPHLLLYRLPAYSPELQPIENLWRPLRFDTSHNHLYDTLDEHCAALARRLREFKRRPRTVLQAIGLLPESPAG